MYNRQIPVLSLLQIILAAGCVADQGTADSDASPVDDTSVADSSVDIEGGTDIKRPKPPDNCEVIDGASCEADCMAVYSSNRTIQCAIDGVFFGCVPALDTGFWDGDDLVTGQFAVCDVLRDDPKQYRYCFEGTFGLYWYYKNVKQWCEGECERSPYAVRCD